MLFGTGVVLLFIFAGSDVVAQNNITAVPEGTTITISPQDSKVQSPAPQKDQKIQVYKQADQQRKDELHAQIRAKKDELESSTDTQRKTILNDEIQQLQDELRDLENRPVEIIKNPVLPDLN
jgi:hypothetical protein